MINWLKKIVSGGSDDQAAPANAAGAESGPGPVEASPENDPTTGTIRIMSVWEVVDRFLQQNPVPTPHGVHALVRAGATNLVDAKELLQVCYKIEEHGYQNPLNPTLISELKESDLLRYLRWHDERNIEKEYYANEIMVRDLIQQFRSR